MLSCLLCFLLVLSVDGSAFRNIRVVREIHNWTVATTIAFERVGPGDYEVHFPQDRQEYVGIVTAQQDGRALAVRTCGEAGCFSIPVVGDAGELMLEHHYVDAYRVLDPVIAMDEQVVELREDVYFFSPYATASDSTRIELRGALVMNSQRQLTSRSGNIVSLGPFVVNPFTRQELVLQVLDNAPLVSADHLKRQCYVSWSGRHVHCVDHWKLSNDSLEQIPFSLDCPTKECVGRLRSFEAILSPLADSVKLTDEFGAFETPLKISFSHRRQRVAFKGRYEVAGGMKAAFFLHYRMPLDDVLSLVQPLVHVNNIRAFSLSLSSFWPGSSFSIPQLPLYLNASTTTSRHVMLSCRNMANVDHLDIQLHYHHPSLLLVGTTFMLLLFSSYILLKRI